MDGRAGESVLPAKQRLLRLFPRKREALAFNKKMGVCLQAKEYFKEIWSYQAFESIYSHDSVMILLSPSHSPGFGVVALLRLELNLTQSSFTHDEF